MPGYWNWEKGVEGRTQGWWMNPPKVNYEWINAWRFPYKKRKANQARIRFPFTCFCVDCTVFSVQKCKNISFPLHFLLFFHLYGKALGIWYWGGDGAGCKHGSTLGNHAIFSSFLVCVRAREWNTWASISFTVCQSAYCYNGWFWSTILSFSSLCRCHHCPLAEYLPLFLSFSCHTGWNVNLFSRQWCVTCTHTHPIEQEVRACTVFISPSSGIAFSLHFIELLPLIPFLFLVCNLTM